MFGKGKLAEDDKASMLQPQRPSVATAAPPDSPEAVSTIGTGMRIAGKVVGEGVLKIYGRIEGEVHASTVLISDGAEVEGNVAAEEVTVGGCVNGTILADHVKLSSTALVAGDIFHRSLSIEENARFEGSSRRRDDAVDAPSVLRSLISPPPAQPEVAPVAGNPTHNGTAIDIDPSGILEADPRAA
jgi:cytoskeletal protein CcmA (bactofilin family)